MATPQSRARLTLGAGLIVLGTGSGIAVLLIALIGAFVSLARIDVPGSQVLTLEPGRYTVFWDMPEPAGQGHPSAPDLPIEVVWTEGGQAVTVLSTGDVVTRYSTGFRVGVSLATFRIVRKAEYRVTAGKPRGPADAKGVLSLTKSLSRANVLQIVLVALALIVAGGGSGVILLLKRPSPASSGTEASASTGRTGG